MVVGLLGNESPDLNRFILVTPKSENDVRLQATIDNQNPAGLPVGVVSEPFRKSVISIKKLEATYGWEIISFYYTFQSYGCITILPPFESGTRFKGMEAGKEYTLGELGL